MNKQTPPLSGTVKKCPDMENLHYLLNPRSLAVIGVSRNPDSFGYPLVEIAQKNGYAGRLYLVNPKADTILGLRCYPSILDIPGEVDAAMIMVPRKLASQAVEDCVRKGVKGIVMITAGFAEAGEEGRRQQDELGAKARGKGIRIIGPNTLGYYSAPVRLDAIMSGFIQSGHVALITQSGNLTQSLTFPGAQRGLGFRYVVGLGNQADVQAHDLIRYFREDPQTSAIAVHIEGLRDGRRFLEEVRETVKVKPVVVVKSGRTETGARAASSHTASIAGNDRVYQAAFRQCGAIQAETFAGLTSVLLAFGQGKPAPGNRVCIISEGGGDCVLTSDACVRRGLEVPELSGPVQERLRSIVPKNGSVTNPIDLAGWENVVEATSFVLEDEAIDGVIVVGGFAGNFHINPRDYAKEEKHVERMCDLIARAGKPVLIYSYSGYKKSPLTDKLAERGIPLFLDHHDAVHAMAALVDYQQIRTRMADREFSSAWNDSVPPAHSASAVPLLEPEAKALLREYGLPVPAEGTARTESEALEIAQRIGYPVAMKVISREILHKSDAGCVKLNLHHDGEVVSAFQEVISNAKRCHPGAEIPGVLVSQMDVEDGVEVILGGLQDPAFGPVIMFGVGGIFVEVLKDVSFRVCPIDEADAEEMIQEIAGYALLKGVRGKPPRDVGALKMALLQVSRLLVENPQIAEIDLNPVKVHRHGLVVLDARIITSQEALAEPPTQESR